MRMDSALMNKTMVFGCLSILTWENGLELLETANIYIYIHVYIGGASNADFVNGSPILLEMDHWIRICLPSCLCESILCQFINYMAEL